MGLARRGGMLVLGKDECLAAIRRGRAQLVVLAGDAGSDVARAVVRATTSKMNPPLERGPAKDELGPALGRNTVAVVVVTDPGFATAIREQLEIDRRET